MNPLVRLYSGSRRLATPVQLWVALLVAVNGLAPLFFITHGEARAVLLVFFAAIVLMAVIVHKVGFTRLMGVGHVLWLPLIIYLWARMGAFPAVEAFGAWLRLVMLLNAASLIMDGVDLVRYLRGDRGEIVADVR